MSLQQPPQLLELGASLHNDVAQDQLFLQPSAQPPVWLPLPNACHKLIRVLHRHDWPDVAHSAAADDMHRAALCIETLQQRGACAGPRLVELLLHEAPLAAAEPDQRNRCVVH